MPEDKRFYTFIIAPSAKSKFFRLSIHYNYLYAAAVIALAFVTIVSFAIVQTLRKVPTIMAFKELSKEKLALTNENLAYKSKMEQLSARVNNVEDQSKKLAQTSGLQHSEDIDTQIGRGGPASFDVVEKATLHLENELRNYEVDIDNQRLQLSSTPRGWPVQGYLTDHFGMRRFGGSAEFHPGLDISVPSGTAVAATADGLVIFGAWRNGYGNAVVIDHGNGMTTRYGHLSSIEVTPGQRLHRGDIIGRAGSTGRSTGPHVHYEVRINNVALDPMRFESSH